MGEGETDIMQQEWRQGGKDLISQRVKSKKTKPWANFIYQKQTYHPCLPPGTGRRETPVQLAQWNQSLDGGYKAASLAGWMGSARRALERWPQRTPYNNDTKLTASGSASKFYRGFVYMGEPPPINIKSVWTNQLGMGQRQKVQDVVDCFPECILL